MAEKIIATASLGAAEGSTINADAAGDELGRSVASAGDVNGDGYEDIIMGAIGNDRGGNLAGAAFVLFGKAGGIGSIDLTNMTAADGFRIIGDQDLDLLTAVAGAGDVNGDGFDDVIVGASGNDAGGSSAGMGYLIFGKAGATRADIDLQSLTASNGFTLQGHLQDDRAGRAVSGAGDINGDGIDDFIVGAPYNDDGGNLAGKAYVVYGKAGATRANIDFSSFAASDGFTIQGSGVSIVGTAVERAGDVNGDGIDDLIVGAYRTSGGGAAYVIYGKAATTRSNIEVATLAAADGFAIFGDSQGDQFGITVSGVGDVNNDGIDDVAVGANRAADRGSATGEAYVIYGKAGSTRGALDVTGIAEADGFLIIGNPGDQTGRAVAAAGDVNNDGIDDFIVSAIDRDPNGISNAGATIVIYGKTGNRGTIDLANPIGGDGFTVIGTGAYDRSGTAVAGVGDLNDDGFDDILIGAPSNDTGGDASGAAYIIYGFAPNTAPVAVNDTFSINEDGSASFAVLANDDDAEDDPLTVTITDGPDHGTATVNSDGTVTYAPDANYSGPDSFKYTLSDGTLTSNEATASIAVAAVNDAPVILSNGGGASAAIDFAENGSGAVTTVFTFDPDGPPVAFQISGADAGLFDIHPSGVLTFKAAPDFETKRDADGNGVYEVTVIAHDGSASDTQDLSITVTDVVEFVPTLRQSGGKFADNLFGTPGAIDIIAGNKGDDTIDGLDQNDQLLGNAGDDTLYGGSGDDALFGGTQDDALHGGIGADRLAGDQGNDDLYGDGDADTFVFGKKFGADTIHDFEDGLDRIEFSKKIFADYAALASHMVQDGADVVISDGAGNSVRIAGTLTTQLTDLDFAFV